MQLVRLSKPRSSPKYSLFSYFFADNRSLSQPCLGGIGAIGLVTPCGGTNTELVEKERCGRTSEGARDNLLNEQGARERRCQSSGAQRTEAVGVRVGAGSDQLHHRARREAFACRTAETSRGKCQQERIVGSERHPQIQQLFTRNMSRSSARADQFQDRVRCIYQRWRRRHHYYPKHYRIAGEMLGRFFYQIILADPVEQQLTATRAIEL
jgi:hypothetical protein